MGQTVVTPLSLTTDHWSDVKGRGSDEGVVIKKNKWMTLCKAEWVMMDVGWPREGSFNLSLISQVERKVFAPSPHGNPDQVPYITIWRSLVEKPFPWVKPFLPQPPLTPQPSAPPNPLSSLYPVLPHREPSKPPVLPPDPNSPLIDLLTNEPPPYQPTPPASPAAPAAAPPTSSPIAGRLRGRRAGPPTESKAFLLREGPNHQLQYWPFSASDLYNWKQHNPPFSRDPVALTGLIESILVTHRPTWDDCQQLLQTLLTVEEKQRVFLEARKQVPGDDGRPTQLPNIIDAAFPLTRPDWDFNTPEGREHLRLYHQLLLAGLRAAARRPTNLAQVRNVIQGKEESPAAFLERLKEAYRMYTPYDPEDPGQAPGVILSFIYQSSSDIRTKLQRLESLQALGLPDLLKEAEKVFNKRETPEEREERRWQKQEERDKKQHREMKKALAAVVSQGQRPPLDKNQCAYCKEKGHWARECPKKSQGPRRPNLEEEYR
uniref:CCHC-type domain-containing protein n=1 Tax=Peromyscus maniculatus bairdii TaxID=230844 RepID=A0A8C8W2Y5_PERMB